MYNIEAEKKVVGYLLLEEEVAAYLFSELKEDHFYSSELREIFAAARQLFEKGEEVSAPMLSTKFNAAKLAELMGQACMSHQLEGYCKVIRKTAAHRQLQVLLSNYRIEAQKTDEPEQLIGKLTEELTGLILDGRPSFISSEELIDRVLQGVEERMEGKRGVVGISTGYSELDRRIYGFQRKHLVFLAAVPKQGKTSMALEFLGNVAGQGYSGLFFSLEMGLEEVGARQISSHGQIDGSSLQRGILAAEDMQRLFDTAQEIASRQIGWVDRPGLNTTEVKAICRQYKNRHGLDFVVIDQLDKLSARIYPGENQSDAIKRNVVALKQIAQELDCTVLVLCQLLDKVVSVRNPPRPQHGDEKGSSAPSEDADVVLYLWRPEFYWPDNAAYKGKAEIIIARQRAGPTGSIWLTWIPRFTKFASMPRDDWPKEVKPDD